MPGRSMYVIIYIYIHCDIIRITRVLQVTIGRKGACNLKISKRPEESLSTDGIGRNLEKEIWKIYGKA